MQTSRLEEFSLSYEAGPAVRNIPEDDRTIAALESIDFYKNIGCNKCRYHEFFGRFMLIKKNGNGTYTTRMMK